MTKSITTESIIVCAGCGEADAVLEHTETVDSEDAVIATEETITCTECGYTEVR